MQKAHVTTMILGIVALYALNIAVDSVLYIVSVAIDGLTLGAAAWLGWKVITKYQAMLRAKDEEYAAKLRLKDAEIGSLRSLIRS